MIALAGWLEDVMDLWPLWAAIGGALGGWILWTFKTWARVNIADPLSRVAEKVAEVEHLVKYHLGPNDGTKPVHRRLIALEKAHHIEQDDEGDQ